MTHCRLYILLAFFISLFRCLVYFIKHEKVTKVKITEPAWKIKEVRDVAYAYTSTIRTFMGFRAIIFGWGLTISEHHIVSQLARLSLFFDMLILSMLVRHFWSVASAQEKSVVQYGSKAALYVQSFLVLSGLLIYV